MRTKIHAFVSCGGEVTEYIICVACGFSQKARVMGQQVSNKDIGTNEVADFIARNGYEI